MRVPRRPGGWWHDFVCPTHDIELEHDVNGTGLGDEYSCAHGCRISGDRFDGAWLALQHQALARQARVAARRFLAGGNDADRDLAIEIVLDYAGLYAEIAAEGWSERSEPWMLRGKLFAQALSEAQWAVGLADAIIVLGPVPLLMRSVAVQDMLAGLAETIHDARHILVVERNDQRSNYTAWLDAAGRLVALAAQTLGAAAPAENFETAVYDHARLAVHPDGWEWEASTYYHVFVLRAYLLALRGVDPQSVPADVREILRRMIDVLVVVATPDGFLPALHDGPYDRVMMHREVREIAALAAQFFHDTGLDRVERWARKRLGASHDRLEDTLEGWFSGEPVAGKPRAGGSVFFENAGYVVLRDQATGMHAVLDAGPHGGAHGHLDKLALYLYGDGARWQPAPGVPPYASALRHGYYARTLAHPTVRVDGDDQHEATAHVSSWDAKASCVLARSDDAVEGIALQRAVRLFDGYLIDVVRARATNGEPRELSLGLRPAVAFHAMTTGKTWRTAWSDGGAQTLHGCHVASVPATFTTSPGRGPSDDPTRTVQVVDWSVTAAEADFVSVYSVGTGSADPHAEPPIVQLTAHSREDGVVVTIRTRTAGAPEADEQEIEVTL